MTNEGLKKPGVQLELPSVGNYLSRDGIGYVVDFKSGELLKVDLEQAKQLIHNRLEEFLRALEMADVILSTAQNKTEAKERLLECGFYIITTSAAEFLNIIELYSKALSYRKSLIRLKEPSEQRGLEVYVNSQPEGPTRFPERPTRYYLFPPLDPNLKLPLPIF